MALGKTQNNGLYLKIVNSKIALTVPEGTEGAVSRKLEAGPKEGQMTHEILYDFVAGKIVGGEVKTGTYGRSVNVYLQDKKDKYIFQIPWNSSVRDAFIKRVPNIDLSKKVEFNIFPDKVTGKPVLLVKQDGNIVEFAFTKDKPNGMPAWKKVKKMGEEKWDSSEADEFQFNLINDFFDQFKDDSAPVHQESVIEDNGEDQQSNQNNGDDEDDTLDDDVPF